MNALVTRYPVHDLENRLLVQAGTEITQEFMEEFVKRTRQEYAIRPLLGYGSIHKDLSHQFSIPPYNAIFSQSDKVAEIFSVMERVSLPLPVLKGLNQFRENDFHTYRHMLMIFALTTLISEELRPDFPELSHQDVVHTGPTHDFGKITVPVPILLKKTPLTMQELDLLRHHTLAGYLLLSHYQQDPVSLAAAIACDHHERLNGAGYPRGIRQQNLKVEITAVADVYDALIAQRPYRPVSFDNRSAIEELTWMAQRGELRWEVVQVLVAYNRRDKPSYKDFHISLECRGKQPEGNIYGMVADSRAEAEKGGREESKDQGDDGPHS